MKGLKAPQREWDGQRVRPVGPWSPVTEANFGQGVQAVVGDGRDRSLAIHLSHPAEARFVPAETIEPREDPSITTLRRRISRW